jgi:hypothetical protein
MTNVIYYIFRSGCWEYYADECHAAYRTVDEPHMETDKLGFRPAFRLKKKRRLMRLIGSSEVVAAGTGTAARAAAAGAGRSGEAASSDSGRPSD